MTKIIKQAKEIKSNKTPVIGIIEGGGTGNELAEVFKKIILTIYKKETGNIVDFLSFKELFGYNPHTFWELKEHYYTKPYSFIRRICLKEVNDILKYNKVFLQKKGIGMFRTAINAETLYYLRRKAKSIKVVPLEISHQGKTISLLFIRDQIQGYYTTDKLKTKNKTLSITSVFSENDFCLIVKFVKKIMPALDFKDSLILFLYKFHIMGIELQKMIDTAMRSSGLKSRYFIYQPDSGIHFLLHDIYSKGIKNIVVICGNEIGDTLLETLIHYYGLGTKETFFTSNFLLGVQDTEALQTMHGSADDIAGKGLVNPIATLKLSAHGLERWLKIQKAKQKMDEIIKKTVKNKIITPDMLGNKKTMEVVDYVLSLWK